MSPQDRADGAGFHHATQISVRLKARNFISGIVHLLFSD